MGVLKKFHWMLDFAYNEDKAYFPNENAAIIMGITRNWALNILNTYKQKNHSIKRVHKKASMSLKFLAHLLIDWFRA